ncbi:hypothetical protein K438DRAFT_2153189 [Mycena galopus ATCC 62051]|nr:hypothetical protein K438DRAFT_2153189 [Mycena galopus ATCC 62051]
MNRSFTFIPYRPPRIQANNGPKAAANSSVVQRPTTTCDQTDVDMDAMDAMDAMAMDVDAHDSTDVETSCTPTYTQPWGAASEGMAGMQTSFRGATNANAVNENFDLNANTLNENFYPNANANAVNESFDMNANAITVNESFDMNANNANVNANATTSPTRPSESSVPHGHSEPVYQASNYVDVSPADKTAIIHSLIGQNRFSADKMRSLTTLHDGMSATTEGKQRKKAVTLKDEFLTHSCTEWCLVSKESARDAGTKIVCTDLGTEKFIMCAKRLKLRLGRVNKPKANPAEKRKVADGATENSTENSKGQPSKKRRMEPSEEASNTDGGNTNPRSVRAFEITSEEEKKQILSEAIAATCNSAVKKSLCTFCGSRQKASELTAIPRSDLDISLLEDAVMTLREKCHQQAIQGLDETTIVGGYYSDPGPLLKILPPRLSELFDEVAVVLVGAKDAVITADMLKHTPLLKHNPLYTDLDASEVRRSAAEYPEHGVPLPVESFFTVPTSAEGSSYTQQANDEAMRNVTPSGMQTCTVRDADSVDSTFQQRKLAALQELNRHKSKYRIKAIKDSPPKTEDGQDDPAERSRLLMVKTVKQLIGKRELSGQQVATELMNWPSKYTNRKYPKFYWTRMLREICPSAFRKKEEEDTAVLPEDTSEQDGTHPETGDTGETIATEEEDNEDTIVLNEHELLRELNEDGLAEAEEKNKSSLYNDILFRPPTLKESTAWELFTQFEKKPVPKSKTRKKEYHRFAPSHPQYTSHCMKRITESELERIPVLVGIPIPRANKEEDKTAYHVAMLALFKPWSGDAASLLKESDESWEDAHKEMLESATEEQLRLIHNMQLIYQSRDAKDDFSAARRKRAAELARSLPSNRDRTDEEEEGYDPIWENAMECSTEGEQNDTEACGSIDTIFLVKATGSAGFYEGSEATVKIEGNARQAGDEDALTAKNAIKALSKRREQYLNDRYERVTSNKESIGTRIRLETDTIPRPRCFRRQYTLESEEWTGRQCTRSREPMTAGTGEEGGVHAMGREEAKELRLAEKDRKAARAQDEATEGAQDKETRGEGRELRRSRGRYASRYIARTCKIWLWSSGGEDGALDRQRTDFWDGGALRTRTHRLDTFRTKDSTEEYNRLQGAQVETSESERVEERDTAEEIKKTNKCRAREAIGREIRLGRWREMARISESIGREIMLNNSGGSVTASGGLGIPTDKTREMERDGQNIGVRHVRQSDTGDKTRKIRWRETGQNNKHKGRGTAQCPYIGKECIARTWS